MGSWGDSGVGVEIAQEELAQPIAFAETWDTLGEEEVLGPYGWRSVREYGQIIESINFVLNSQSVKLHRKTRRRLRNRLRSLLGIDRRLRKNRKVQHYKVRRMMGRRWKRKQRERGGGYSAWDLEYYTRIKLPLHKAGLRKFRTGELAGLSKYLRPVPGGEDRNP